MTVTLDDLAGPADADMFRMTVDYGRWYIDPLPTCDIAAATEDRWPSVSHVKKAADKDWSFLTVNRIAALEPTELERIAKLDHTQRGDSIRSHEKYAKNVAFGRGTIVHLWAEDLAAGRDCREITDSWLAACGYPTQARTEALIYQSAMIDFFHTYQPELVAAEYVTIHRTLNEHGYGATPDGLFRIPRVSAGVVALDWKTRGESSSHAAYPEEAAQIAAGARAEYMIVRVDDHAERRPMPDIVGGYVVSIKPDGARLYPVDIDRAFTHWTHLHQWWVHKLDEKQSIGRVLAKRSAPKVSSAEADSGDALDGPSSRVTSAEEQPKEQLCLSTPLTPLTTSETTTSSWSEDERSKSSPDGLTTIAGPTPSISPGLSSSTPSKPLCDASTAEPNWRFEAKRRYDLLNDAQRAEYTARKTSIDTTDQAAVFALLDEIEPFNMQVAPAPAPSSPSSPVPAHVPDEGDTVNPQTIAALRRAFEALPAAAQLWISTLTAQGKTAGVDWRTGARPSVRRYELGRAIIKLAEHLETS